MGERVLKRLTSNQKIVVALVYVSSMILNSLDSTIVNVSLATLGRQFGVPASEVESVVIAYIVSLAVFMPASGWLGKRFGARNVFLLALSLFTLASLLCGFAQSLNQLVLFRVLQGAGGGLLTPVGMTLLYRTFAPAERIGVGRVLMFATNPIWRRQTIGEYRMLYNAMLNWNALGGANGFAPLGSGMS